MINFELGAQTHRTIKEDYVVNSTFLGIPTSYDNETTDELMFSSIGIPEVVKTDTLDIVPLSSEEVETDVSLAQTYRIEFDFTVEETFITYVTWLDVLGDLGGVSAIIDKIMAPIN